MIFLIIMLMASAASCGRKAQKTGEKYTNTDEIISTLDQNGQEDTSLQATSNSDETTHESTSAIETVSNPKGDTQLVQSANVDLDNDGENEEVEVLQVNNKGQADDVSGELDGILRIKSKTGTVSVTFVKKPAGMTGVMTSFEFKDLDGDGVKDVFIVVPDAGAAFSLNYFFIYDYKKARSISFSADNSLADFANGFVFKYKGDGKLEISNDSLNFKGEMDVGNNLSINNDEDGSGYDSSWVEPTPVVIGEDARITLVGKNSAGKYEIKVPIPVFGVATVDMIGEIDLFYIVDSGSNLILEHFDAYDFDGEKKLLIGKWKAK